MTGMPEQVLIIEPPQILRFYGPVSEVVSTELAIRNPSDDQVAFKVKTTAPRRYAVRPNSGVLNAGESVNVSVMRQAFELDPNEKIKDKFMIQSIILQAGQTAQSVWQNAEREDLMDVRLKVVYDDHTPSNRSSVDEEEFHKMESEVARLSKEVVELKEERRRLMDIALNSVPKIPSGIALMFHEKKNMFLIFIMLILCFVAGVILSEAIIKATYPAVDV